MFKFLKEKIKGALSIFSEKVEDAEVKKEEIKEEILEEKQIEKQVTEPVQIKKHEEKIVLEVREETPKVKEIKQEKVEIIEKKEKKEEVKVIPNKEETVEQKSPEKKGFFAKIAEKITTTKISEEKFDEYFWSLELALLESNVAVEVIEKIKNDLKKELTETQISRGKVEETVLNCLKKSLSELFIEEKFDLISMAKKKKPFVICFVGINGSGKTTTLAKMAKYFQDRKLGVVMAAADTFRAAAIDQLQIHADKLGVKLIKHDYGADAAAVAFDAIKHAEAKQKDVVLIDTAGRLHSNSNLIEEMKKITRIAKPDLKIFVGESITGNDCIEQAQKFNEAINIDGIILSKADIDEKGGAALSVSFVTKKPILFLGTGQEYSDLEEFSKEKILKNLGL